MKTKSSKLVGEVNAFIIHLNLSYQYQLPHLQHYLLTSATFIQTTPVKEALLHHGNTFVLYGICGNAFTTCALCGNMLSKQIQAGSNSGSQVPQIFIFPLLTSQGQIFAFSKSVANLPLSWTEAVLAVFAFQCFSASFSFSLVSFGCLLYFWF